MSIVRALIAWIAVAAIVLSLGCYGGKLVRMPINAESASVRADSLESQQRRVLRALADLRSRLDQNREERLRYRAEQDQGLRELEEAVRVLTNRIEDQAQRNEGLGRTRPPRVRILHPGGESPGAGVLGDSTRAGADTSSVTAADAVDPGDALFRASYLDLTRGNYDLAIQGFKNYLVRYPSGGRLPEVHYYLGEGYYASDRHLESVGEFQYVIREFPRSRLAPAAYLKTGLCYEHLGEQNLAGRAYRNLIDKHPTTEEAAQAREALGRIEN